MQEASSAEKPEKEKEAPKDEEGLLLEYDVIICGTGLVQSILASALARAGKTVLHCDAADHYGELDAVWTYPYLHDYNGLQTKTVTQPSTSVGDGDVGVQANRDAAQFSTIELAMDGTRQSLQLHSSATTTTFPFVKNSKVVTHYGAGTVERVESAPSDAVQKLSISLDDWRLENGSSPTLQACVAGDPDSAAANGSIASKQSLEARKLLSNPLMRYFALDASPVLVFSAGRAVQGMLASGVAEYLEFKALQGLYWLDQKDGGKKTASKPAASSSEYQMWRVPCSKSDIFKTKLLAPLDKRRLMKFIQLTMDYATSQSVQEEVAAAKSNDDKTGTADGLPEGANGSTATEVDESTAQQVQSLNERHLNQGRSLARPQNKAVATDELEKLQGMIADGKLDLETYLTQQKLSPRLRGLVRHALALETTTQSKSLLNGMNQLRHHIQSLGRYGTTAFLVPMYGSGELSQAFCRSAAVFGATYLLRRAPLRVLLHNQADEDGAKPSAVTKKRVHSVRIKNDTFDFDSGKHVSAGDPQSPEREQSKDVRCSHVIIDRGSLQSNASSTSVHGTAAASQRTLRRISIVNGKLLDDDGDDSKEQRHLLIIPPGVLGNPYAVHCMLMDHSVQVAPVGCTVMHLTTTIDVAATDDASTADGAGSEDSMDRMLEKVTKVILETSSNASGEPIDEIYHTSFSFESPSSSSMASTRRDANDAGNDAGEEENEASGVHYCSRATQAITAGVAFEQAEKIFRTICPGLEFLGLSEKMDTIVKERVGDRSVDDDDERNMLDSAVSMIDEANSSSKTETAPSPGESGAGASIAV